jgi:spectrin beta
MDQMWEELIDITSERQKKLQESQEFFQFLSECDDSDAWLTEVLRQVSTEELGNKLAVTESFIKRNQEILDSLERFRETMQLLHDTGDKICDYPEVDNSRVSHRLNILDARYKEVLEKAQLRHQRLLDALSMYKVFSVSDTVHTWITEKEKLLTTLAPSDEIEELAVLRQRFEFFENEMSKNLEKVRQVQEISDKLAESEHPETMTVVKQQEALKQSIDALQDTADAKRDAIQNAILLQEFLINCAETKNWIREKAKLIESTDELGDDLEGVMQLQRRLGGLQRDMGVLENKIDDLDDKANILLRTRPKDKETIERERDEVHALWNELNEMLKVRDDRLSASSELQRFLQDLDHFQVWLSRTQSSVASEDMPKDLDDTERQKSELQSILAEVRSYEPEFERLMEFGRRVTKDQTDSQHVLLAQRLNGLEEGWETLLKMAADRENFLEQCHRAQSFFRDALQVDVILSKQEVFLAKEDTPTTLESALEAIKQHENFVNAMEANDEKIDKVVAQGRQLVANNNLHSDRIKAKCDQILERRNTLRNRTSDRELQLNETRLVQEFVQEIEDTEEWISEKMIVATDDSHRDSKSLAARYSKFKAFEDELDANKDKIAKLIEEGEQLAAEHPDVDDAIYPRLAELRAQWDELKKTAENKSARMAEENREKLVAETATGLESWIEHIITEDETIETTEISLVELNEKNNEILKQHKDFEEKQNQLKVLEEHIPKLMEQFPERQVEFEEVLQTTRVRLQNARVPLDKKASQIQEKRRILQLLRDLDDEKDWVKEKLRLLENPEVGNNLLEVQQLLRRHRLLKSEVENHKPQMERVINEVEKIVQEGHPRSQEFIVARDELEDLWQELEDALLRRQHHLDDNNVVQQYLFDASEAKAWMGELELYLMTDEKTKNEQAADNAIKKHEHLQKSIDNYGDEIRSLGDRAHAIQETPEESISRETKDMVASKQAGVDKQYASLKDLSSERRHRLQEILKLYQLLREIFDLEAWIAERTLVASSHEMGVDYEHCCLLRERFAEFTRDTKEIGKLRVGAANEYCDNLIDQGHTDSAEIAEYKDRINEAWADLSELMVTRTQLLKAAWDLHKFLCDCHDVLERILEKSQCIPEEHGNDAKTVASLQRQHAAFEHELSRLGQQVEGIIEAANHLLPSYAGEKEQIIQDRRDEVVNAWRQLQHAKEQRKVALLDSADFHRFMAMIRELRLWMDGIRQEMKTKEKPRDISGVELLMNTHKSFQAELDARAENFSICLSLGRTLLNRGHPRVAEVREKCILLVKERQQLSDQWFDRWEQLCLILEVFQFARDSAMAEAWLISQEHYLANRNLGENLDETLNLLKKHVAFEKAVALQEERFNALKKLTTFELRERERTPETEAARHREREKRIEDAIKEFQPPPPVKLPPPESDVDAQEIQPQRLGTQQSGRPGTETPPQRAGTLPRTSKVAPTAKGIDTPDTSASRPPQPQDMEGLLFRKHEWQEEGKKAGTRSWHELFIVLRSEELTLSAYKDQRHAKERPLDRYHHEPQILLGGASASPATDYNKRPHVFRLKLANGGEYLFQARNDKEMHDWVRMINAVSRSRRGSASVTGSERDIGRYATLPGSSSPGPSSGQTLSASKSEKKKFFTMKSKK